jgi:FlaA1/EpsC-like NDP-sugar epimerase
VTIKLLPFDVGVTFIAYLFALFLRFDGAVPGSFRDSFLSFVVVAIVVQIGIAASFGLYSEVWRYASHPKTRGIVWAGMGRRLMMAGLVAGSIMLSIDAFATVGMRPVPLSVTILGTIFSLIGIGLVRFLGTRFLFRPPGSDTT